MLQQVQQFGFESRVNFAAATGLGRVGQTVEAMLLPGIKPAAYGFRMHVAQRGELFQREAFGGQENGLRPLPQTMGRAITMSVFQRRPLGV